MVAEDKGGSLGAGARREIGRIPDGRNAIQSTGMGR